MKKRVLLIEDSPTDTSIVKALLANEDIEVFTASGGHQGISEAERLKPDLVILDLILPDIDGFQVCSRLKSNSSLKNTIVVILSIKDTIPEITRAFQSGADDYVIKPPIPDFLSKKIRLYLGMH